MKCVFSYGFFEEIENDFSLNTDSKIRRKKRERGIMKVTRETPLA